LPTDHYEMSALSAIFRLYTCILTSYFSCTTKM